LLGVESGRDVVVGGDRFTIADVVRGSLAEFRLDRELPWSLVAFALYLPPHAAWTNKHGQRYNVDQVCLTLCREQPGAGSCFGTHVPFALAVVLAADTRQPTLSPEAKHAAVEWLREAVRRVRQSALPGGGWNASWSHERSERNAHSSPARASTTVTGHTLEWLALLPRELSVEPILVDRGCAYLVEDILDAPLARIGDRYSAYTHAGAALRAWHPDAWEMVLAELEAGPGHAVSGASGGIVGARTPPEE